MFGGKKIRTKKGKEITLLTPGQKSKKFAEELRINARYTNSGDGKCDKNGMPMLLNDTQRAYRSGYLDARKDNAKLYKYHQKKNGTR